MPFRPCNERELYWNFDLAEADSTRYGAHYAYRLTPMLLDNVRRRQRDLLTEDDWEKLREAVVGLRAPLVGQLLVLGTDWFLGDVSMSGLSSVRLLNYSPFVEVSPNRDLATFVSALDSGVIPRGEAGFAANYKAIRTAYDPAKVRGVPILVAPAQAGPYTEIEGLTRMSVLISKFHACEIADAQVPILLGVCPRLGEWSWR